MSGCWKETGPALPDLEPSHNEITQRTERLRQIGELMEEDIERFEQLEARLVGADGELYASPFPLDLYKHVAVDCLNEPWSRQEGQAKRTVDGHRLPEAVACRPEFLGRLAEVLDEQVPERDDEALERLGRLDRLRRLRGRLRWRLARIEPILDDSRELLASRRADLRQLRQSYERRRTEFGPEHWSRLQDRLDTHAEDLGRLEDEIEALDRARPRWPETLDESIKKLYLKLSKLRQ